MDSFTDGPDFGFARKGSKGLNGEIGHYIIELAHQPLIRSKDNGSKIAFIGWLFATIMNGN
jgi:hypothetical protein